MRFYVLTLISALLSALPDKASALTLSAGYRGGLAHSSQPSNGVIANLRIVPKFSVAYSYNYAGIDVRGDIDDQDVFGFGSSPVDVRKAYIRRTFQELQFRFHPKEGSFFLAGGVIQGSGQGHLSVYCNTTPAHLERKYEFSSTLYSLGIGNLWDRSSMMVGFDWVGMTRKASYKAETKETITEEAGPYVQEAEDNFLDEMHQRAGRGGLTALMFHLGFAI